MNPMCFALHAQPQRLGSEARVALPREASGSLPGERFSVWSPRSHPSITSRCVRHFLRLLASFRTCRACGWALMTHNLALPLGKPDAGER